MHPTKAGPTLLCALALLIATVVATHGDADQLEQAPFVVAKRRQQIQTSGSPPQETLSQAHRSAFVFRRATSSAPTTSRTTSAPSITSSSPSQSSSSGIAGRPLVGAAAAFPSPYAGNWAINIIGNSGVSAQQIAVVDENHAIIYDKVEANPLQVSGHPAYGAIYRFSDNSVRPLHVNTNSFCAGGTFLANGTMLSIGGNAVQLQSTYNDSDGRQSIRFYDPCPTVETCDVYDNPAVRYLKAGRWYPTTMRFFDGSALIIGGMADQGYSNTPQLNVANMEYYPKPPAGATFPGASGLINSPFLVDSLNANAFPIVFALPNSQIFFAANTMAMIYNPYTNVETRLPNIPNGVRLSYPMAGSGVLLQMSPSNSYTPTILLCGGSNVTDAVGSNTNINQVSSQKPASAQCARMTLNGAGIQAGWEVDTMPIARTMHNLIVLPDGNVLIVNGARTGVSGYGTVPDSIQGMSNADHPAYQAVLYNPNLPRGSRFSATGIPPSTIARMYHSSATLRPSGDIMIAGSAPNLYFSSTNTYPTELRVEALSPPYMSGPRPSIAPIPARIPYASWFTVTVTLPTALVGAPLAVNLVDLGFQTHGLSMNSRNVQLVINSQVPATGPTVVLNVTAPPHPGVWPAGPGWIFVLANGIPAPALKAIIGSGVVGRN